MKLLILGAAVAGVLALPLLSFAQTQTYDYVNNIGVLQSESAPDAATALLDAVNIAPDSGVILESALVVPPVAVTITTTSSTTGATTTPVMAVASPITTTTTSSTSNVASPFPNGTYNAQLGQGAQANSLWMTLLPDGDAELTSLYAATSTPMFENGMWSALGNGQVQLTLLGNQNGIYATPDVLTFTPSGASLVATEYNSTVYGTQGFTFVTQP